MKKLLWIVLLLPIMAMAQDASALEGILNLLKPLIDAYAGKFGWMVQVVSVVGSLRVAIKPIMTLIDVVVKATPSEEDDDLVQKIEENKIYKAFKFVLDWASSIKL